MRHRVLANLKILTEHSFRRGVPGQSSLSSSCCAYSSHAPGGFFSPPVTVWCLPFQPMGSGGGVASQGASAYWNTPACGARSIFGRPGRSSTSTGAALGGVLAEEASSSTRFYLSNFSLPPPSSIHQLCFTTWSQQQSIHDTLPGAA